MSLFDTALFVERRPELHYARLLILLEAFLGRWKKPCDGVTKLAKLDFLLRYPTYLERALVVKGVPSKNAEVKDYERGSVEASMVQYRFGPWDDRYLRWVRELEARDLITVDRRSEVTLLALSERGQEVCKKLASLEMMELASHRAKLVAAHFDQSSKNLFEFLLRTFPELSTLHLGEEIPA